MSLLRSVRVLYSNFAKPNNGGFFKINHSNASSFQHNSPKISNGGQSIRYACSYCTDESHSKHWIIDKITSVALIAILPAAIAHPLAILDYTLIPLLTYHHYSGCEAILIDYARPITLGNFGARLCHLGNMVITVAMTIGLLLFVYHDIGIGNAIHKTWTVNHDKPTKD